MQSARRKISIIGLGGGAAALLYSYLRNHPGIFSPSEPTHYFSDAKVFARGVNWLESQFEEAYGRTCCELALDYLQNAQSATLIAKTLPEAKLLAVIENPILAVKMSYVEARKQKIISSQTTLAEFLKDNPNVLLSAKQGRQLTHFFGYYAPTDLLVLVADEVRDNPLKIIEHVYSYVGVDNKFVPLSLVHLVPEEEPDLKNKPGIVKRNYRKLKLRFIRFKRTMILRLHPPTVNEELAFAVARKLPLSPELEAFLKDYFREDVAILSRLMHRSFTHEWGFEN